VRRSVLSSAALLAALLGGSAARADVASRRVAPPTEIPAWALALESGTIDLDAALTGALELRDGLGHLALDVDPTGDARRGADLLLAWLGPDGLAGALDAAVAPAHGLTARPVRGVLSSAFGLRKDPFRKRRMKDHKGIDVRAERNTPVFAAGAGVVARARRERGYGRVVYVDHGDGRQTRYAHLQSYAVAAGQRVAAGELVGRVGSSGRATGPHLHFEVRQDGDPVAPDQLADLPLFTTGAGLLDALLEPLAIRAETLAAEAAEPTRTPAVRKRPTRRVPPAVRPSRRPLRSQAPRS
jgi:murein DD-endopeptidase MepM/ murein hydrolase activator NlpD